MFCSFQWCMFRWCLSKLGMFPWEEANMFRQVVKKAGMKEGSKKQGDLIYLFI